MGFSGPILPPCAARQPCFALGTQWSTPYRPGWSRGDSQGLAVIGSHTLRLSALPVQ